MPHFLNVIKRANPLIIQVSELHPLPTALASLQLTGQHMHKQPVCCTFLDGSVDCLFFESDGTYLRSEELLPPSSLKTVVAQAAEKVPVEFERVRIHHIHKNEDSLPLLEKLKKAGESIYSYNKYVA